MATRRRLLARAAQMLRSTSYRDLKVVDIAREAGTSPATFYQYFPDVEAAILALADEMVAEGHHLVEIVEANRWRGRRGYDGALELADEFIRFWDVHQAVLRVIDLATEEGDGRFANVRTRLLNEVNNALAAAIDEQRRKATRPRDEVDPMAMAGVLVAMLAHVSSHHYGFEFWGVRTGDLRTSMARLVFWAVTGQRPPVSAAR
jgi:AcrR family transcriptional regulator